MVRNPLARHLPGDERLNAVDCILPFFDPTTVINVVMYPTGKINEIPTSAGPKFVHDRRELGQPDGPGVGVGVLGWPSDPDGASAGARPTKRRVRQD